MISDTRLFLLLRFPALQEFERGEIAERLVRAHGVVDVFPTTKLGIELRDVLAVGKLDKTPRGACDESVRPAHCVAGKRSRIRQRTRCRHPPVERRWGKACDRPARPESAQRPMK